VRAQGAMFGIPVKEEPQALGAYIFDSQEIEVGSIKLKAFHVPGHSPGSVALYSELREWFLWVMYCSEAQ